MSGNLSDRLKRIRQAAAIPHRRTASSVAATPPAVKVAFAEAGWHEIAPEVLHRSVPSPFAGLPDSIDPRLAILCPSAQNAFVGGRGLGTERMLLFDLETTGLSGGAGTVAFLAAFGRFERTPGETNARLIIDQYLLLDYPGESAFLDSVLAEFARSGGEPVLGSYNGRSFDMQILKTRCIMNGLTPPDPAHLDLVHAARRLWRSRLPSCSLGDVERGVLGLDRGDDIPGSEAPDAWFDFLKTGASERLLAIGDHNRRDLEGLAALLVRMDAIARDPEAAAASGEVDREGLALRWLAFVKSARRAGRAETEGERVARFLLESAVASGSARAACVLAGELSREGHAERAVELRRAVAEADDQKLSARLRASACASLATDAQRRLKDRFAALAWLEKALSLEELAAAERARLEKRRDRLSGNID